MIFISNVAGHQLSVFNSEAQVQIGGKWNHAKQRVERPFSGVMAGLVFNGLRLLDLASEKDGRTSVRGDVQLMTGIRDRQHEPLQRMQQVGFNVCDKYQPCISLEGPYNT
jgi:leucine-rich repeat transmembrane neuronal protein 1/2